MLVSRVASRYAKPILELAEEKKVLDEVKEDMQVFTGICNENRDLSLMLKSPIIPHLKKADILKKLFEGKMNELTLQAFDLIARKNRENLLDDIAKEFIHQYNLSKGLEEVSVTSSIELNAEQVRGFEKMSQGLLGKKPLLNKKINPAIIGGYVLKAGDKQIDQSVSGQLKNIKLALQEK